MTRTVRDAALMLDALAGPDDRDRHSLPADGGASYLEACDAGIAGLSVAWSADLGHGRVDPEVADICARGGGALRVARLPRGSGHAHLGRPRGDLPHPGERGGVCRLPATASRKASGTSTRPSSSSCAWASASPRSSTSARSCARRELWTEVHRFLARFDLLITPTLAVAAFPLDAPPIREIAGQPVSPAGLDALHVPFNLTGQPAASVPAGFTAAGLPVGLQIVGRRHADRTVLAASAAFEAAAPWADSKPPLD